MTEREKMLAGELYFAQEEELYSAHCNAVKACGELNDYNLSRAVRTQKLKTLFGRTGENIDVAPGFWCDYGSNIEVGENFYCNYGVCILDVCKVEIGDNCLIGPQVGIYTACHPIDRKTRVSGLELGKPVKIGNDCWIGGGAIINPGVTLGDNVIVGSGAVVTRSFPSNVIIAGNPAKIIKKL